MSDDMIRADGLRVDRPDFHVDDVSFAVARGTVAGLVGPNGAGKTTVIRSLLGLVASDAGSVELLGEAPGSSAALASTGVVLDQPTAAPEWRVDAVGRRLAPFYPRWDALRFAELLRRFGVPTSGRVGELSRGQGVKLSLASALAQRPELLILDEPSSGLDPASRREVADAIREFMLDPAHAVLFSTHITTELDDLADELLVMVGGRMAHHGALPDAVEAFAVARGAGPVPSGPLLGASATGGRWTGLVRMEDSAAFGPEVVLDAATIDDIVIHLAAERREVLA